MFDVRILHRVLLLACCGVGCASFALAADQPVQTTAPGYSTSAASGNWSASTREREPETDGFAPAGDLAIRVYEDLGSFGRVFAHRHPVLGVDVRARIERCADGRSRIRAMHIGGWEYRLDGDCDRPPLTGDERIASGKSPADAAAAIRCDPAGWNCRTTRP